MDLGEARWIMDPEDEPGAFGPLPPPQFFSDLRNGRFTGHVSHTPIEDEEEEEEGEGTGPIQNQRSTRFVNY